MSALYQAVRPLIFKLKPEPAHHLVMTLLRLGGEIWPGQPLLKAWFHPRRSGFEPVQAFGLTFPNPIGLAAGFDKDAAAFRGLACR
jgi:dihydroorotate dehydrogenase